MRDLFLRACRGERIERTPIWLMRQAGRSLPEYRALRERVDFVTLCRTPDLAAEATLQPVDRLDVDAAILFSDILVPAECLGLAVRFEPGPVLDAPLRTADDVRRLSAREPEASVGFVYETIRILGGELAGRVPLIGFAAAPLTLAAYLVEGRGSRGFPQLKRLLLGDPATAHLLMEKLTALTARYLAAQIDAGVQAVQLFDTWAGLFDRETYREFGLRYNRRVLEHVGGRGAVRIYFALDAVHLLADVAESGADVIGIDWRISLDRASELLGGRFPLQGNLEPCTLLCPPPVIERQVARVLDAAAGLPGHVFNLGHGVLPDTPVEHLMALVEAVRAPR